MTREEAVKQLTINRPSTYTELREAIDMAIEALKPKPMQKFDNVKQHIDRLAGDYKCWDERLSHEEVLELSRMLEQQPSVTPQQNVGRWMIHPNGVYAHLVCSKCLTNAPYDCKTNYCPNCGCRMKGEDE